MSTGIFRFLDMSEQRFVSRVPVTRLEGTYGTLFTEDYIGGGASRSLQDFHDAMQGRFGQFEVTYDSVLYTNLYFDQDVITFQENSVNLYNTQVKLKQFPATGFPTITVSNPSLPTLGNGTTGPQNQYPNPLAHHQSNSIVDLDDAGRFAYHRINTAIPSGALQLRTITPAEATIMENFFIQMAGQYGIFTLTYNGISYVNCRFTTDSLVIDYGTEPGVRSMTLPWMAVPS